MKFFLLSALLLALCFPAAAAEAPGVPKVSVKLVPETSTIMVGEPLVVQFETENRTDGEIGILFGHDLRNTLHRPESFGVLLVDEYGTPLPGLKSEELMAWSGMVGYQKVPAHEVDKYRLFLPQWVKVTKPGRYTLRVKRTLSLGIGAELQNRFDPDRSAMKLNVEASVPLTVTPADSGKMGQLIADLGAEVRAHPRRDRGGHAMEKLLAIEDDRLVPELAAACHTRDYSLIYHALCGLAKFKDEQALEMLKWGMRIGAAEAGHAQSVDNLRLAAVYALEASVHPGAIPYLAEFRHDPTHSIRLAVTQTLARKLDKAAAIPILEDATRDSSGIIAQEAVRMLRDLHR